MNKSQKPTKTELMRANYYLETFEKQVKRSRGKPIEMGYEGGEALKRIKDLRLRFPDNEEVAALFERGRTALLASKGETRKITPAMLAYRSRTESDPFTITAVPDDVEPVDLVNIFATAVQEQNYDLYCACLHESWLDTPSSEKRARYFWDNSLERFQYLYVYVEPVGVQEIRLLKGEEIDADEAFFLDDTAQADVVEHAGAHLEEAVVPVRRFDENGRQTGSPTLLYLRRRQGERWTIYSGFPI